MGFKDLIFKDLKIQEKGRRKRKEEKHQRPERAT